MKRVQKCGCGRPFGGALARRTCASLLGGAWVAGSLALAGCATWKPAKPVAGQPQGYAIDCSGPSLSWAHCFQKAGRACPHGYAIAKRSERGGGHVVSGDFFDLVGDKVQHRRMEIRCKDGTAASVVGSEPAVPPPSGKAKADDDDD